MYVCLCVLTLIWLQSHEHDTDSLLVVHTVYGLLGFGTYRIYAQTPHAEVSSRDLSDQCDMYEKGFRHKTPSLNYLHVRCSELLDISMNI